VTNPVRIFRPKPHAVHTLYVPPSRTLDDVIEEIAVLGKLAGPEPPEGGTWHVWQCDGDPCICEWNIDN
jgi:hypothetical protein